MSDVSLMLRQAFAEALRRSILSPGEEDFITQVGEDIALDELPGLTTADLALGLAEFWRFGEARVASGPAIRLSRGRGADGRDLGLDVLEIVQDDSPFLVDSVMGELSESGYDVRAMVHPVVHGAAGGPVSMILVMLGDVGEDRRAALLEGLERTLADVRLAVSDFPAMKALMRQTAEALRAAPSIPGPYPLDEYLEFLDWLSHDRFVFLGARSYEYPRTADGGYLAEEPRFGPQDCLGVLRDESRMVLRRASEPAVLAPELEAFLERGPLITAKSNLRARVHRRSHMDYVGVRRYDASGVAVGEVRFVGLYTVEAYEEPARQLPLIRRKIERVLARSGENPSQHSEKRFRYIVETYPRDELFQIDEEALYVTACGILHLHDRPRVRLFTRRDTFDRFVSCLLFIPRDRYDSEVSRRAGEILGQAFGGRVSAVYPSFSERPLARLHFIIGVRPQAIQDAPSEPDISALEADITAVMRTWSDRFEAAARCGGVAPGRVGEVLTRYADAFPAGYRDQYEAGEAFNDLTVIERFAESDDVHVRAYRDAGDAKTEFRFKLYRKGDAAPLAEVLPILDNMGLRAITEEGFPITPTAGREPATATWVHEFLLQDARGERLRFADVKTPFEDTFLAVWNGQTENDGFNRLVLELGAGWREVALLRSLARYRQQSGLDPSQAVQEMALRDHAEIARLILDMFQIKFDPAVVARVEQRAEQAEAVFNDIVAALQEVESLDADRVLRRLALLVRALKRTNFYQVDAEGAPKPHISFKIASSELEDLPAPKPFREIFVWARHVEGVHLRFGPIARGGLRWSDRRDDFRTEVLGLAKAQQVKNAVIVPVGSKGGFYPKQLPKAGPNGAAPLDAIREEGVRAYRTFLAGLLDITDNLDAQGGVIRPDAVIAHDADDPYLVVAADKGTATFSDIANGVAESYGFWLGDAFASGGSAGYDHKAMAITARGAWEAVKRHFRELGKDIQSEPFTCVGVGDMSGDVFGNGALLSRAMKLTAAFDHRHIFLDPDPDPERSWEERKRLFDLPRSSWDDYDRSVISAGGGVFPRTAKEVPLSPEVRAMLDLDAETVSPADLIRAILKARTELLYLGGIGTYVKAPLESNAEVGDKANDPVRVDATELRCRVVGEGANLGVTQAARIVFARFGNDGAGGRIETDAIDNSAGVDTSDHEVNIKILLGQAERNGELKREDRDGLLASMTDEVASHVLAHNYDQTLGLSLQEASAVADLDAHAGFMSELEAAGRLDRRVEGLPRPSAMTELRAQGRGLTRPELAVLTAYGKLALSAGIVAGQAPDDPYFATTLRGYFPAPLAKFNEEMVRHRLRREIISTVLANRIVDMAGPTFPSRLMEAAGCDADALVSAFEVARQVFRLTEAWNAVNGLDLKAPASVQTALYQEIARTLRGRTFWLARRPAHLKLGVQGLIDSYRPAVDLLQQNALELLSPVERAAAQARHDDFVQAGAPSDVARVVADLRAFGAATEIVDLARDQGWTIDRMARLYGVIGSTFGFDRVRAAAAVIRPQDSYERTALRGLIVELILEQGERTRVIANQVEAAGKATEPLDVAAAAAVASWTGSRRSAVDRARETLDRLENASDGWSFAKLTLASAALRDVSEPRRTETAQAG